MAHGDFINWLKKIEISHSQAKKMMKISNEFPNGSTSNHLGTEALYLIATLPEEEKQVQLEKVEQGDNPTVRELQEVKRKLKDSEERNKRLAEHKLNIACNARILVRDSSNIPRLFLTGRVTFGN
ncbi:hypothetical protein ADO07_01629 [Streptococcus parauberis]|nr:hypothetical protein ADO07_01629 [Streptococcus parauberis]